MMISFADSHTASHQAASMGATRGTPIDASLARCIRRTYFRELDGQWKRLKQARTQAMGRNASITRRIDILTAGWMNVDVTCMRERLLETWRDYGWRFDEQRLHPGLSDRAWAAPH